MQRLTRFVVGWSLSLTCLMAVSLPAYSQSLDTAALAPDAQDRGYGGHGGWNGGGGREEFFVCESHRDRRSACMKPQAGRARLVEQFSRSRCVEGVTWGQDRRAVWVDEGCRARFGVEAAYQGPREVRCESHKDRYNRCDWPRGWGRPELSRQLSDARCVYNVSWGMDRGDIWVDRGCRAVFRAR